MHVLEAEWNGNKVVLKTPKALGTDSMAVTITNALLPRNTKREDVKMSTEELVYHVCFSYLMQYLSTLQLDLPT